MFIGCRKHQQNNYMDESEFDNVKSTTNINVIINGKKYHMSIENNETAQAFVKLLPKEFNMNELNGNEKYIYLDSSLPTNSSKLKYINAGDVMLYGNNCLVIFYQSFDTTYSYTKIGHIDDLANLGNDNIHVIFEK